MTCGKTKAGWEPPSEDSMSKVRTQVSLYECITHCLRFQRPLPHTRINPPLSPMPPLPAAVHPSAAALSCRVKASLCTLHSALCTLLPLPFFFSLPFMLTCAISMNRTAKVLSIDLGKQHRVYFETIRDKNYPALDNAGKRKKGKKEK